MPPLYSAEGGRIAQRQSTCLTRRTSQVRILLRPPAFPGSRPAVAEPGSAVPAGGRLSTGNGDRLCPMRFEPSARAETRPHLAARPVCALAVCAPQTPRRLPRSDRSFPCHAAIIRSGASDVACLCPPRVTTGGWGIEGRGCRAGGGFAAPSHRRKSPGSTPRPVGAGGGPGPGRPAHHRTGAAGAPARGPSRPWRTGPRGMPHGASGALGGRGRRERRPGAGDASRLRGAGRRVPAPRSGQLQWGRRSPQRLQKRQALWILEPHQGQK